MEDTKFTVREEDDIRLIQAKRYWDIGVGRGLGFERFEDSLATVPEIPDHLKEEDPDFPLLIVEEPRFGLKKLCDLISPVLLCGRFFTGEERTDDGITYYRVSEQRAHSFIPYDDRSADPKEPRWIRMRVDRRNLGKSPSECRKLFMKDEVGATALQGVCLLIQQPKIFTYEEGKVYFHGLNLPGSVNRFSPHCSAMLEPETLGWKHEIRAAQYLVTVSRREC